MSTSPSQKQIIILGGSYAGVSSAHYILKHVLPSLPEKNTYQVTLISASSQALCRPACPRALISDNMFPQDRLFVDIKKQFQQYPAESFRFFQGTATELNHLNRTVTFTLGTEEPQSLEFYALIIATGASTPSPLLGLNTHEEGLRKAWLSFREALPSAKSIIIAGGGPTSIETAGELGEHLNGRAGWFQSKLQNPKVNITVVTASEILPVLRPSIAQTAEAYLAKVGVTIIKNSRIVTAEPRGAGSDVNFLTAKSKLTLDDGTTLEADLYVPATGTKPNTSFVPQPLLTSDSRINTNPTTLRVEGAGARIYALGDASSYARPAVHNILSAVPVVGANIKRDLLLAAGKSESEIGQDKVFQEDKTETQLVPIGKSKGVGAAKGWKLPSWMIWAIKGRDYWLWTTGGLWSGKQWTKES